MRRLVLALMVLSVIGCSSVDTKTDYTYQPNLFKPPSTTNSQVANNTPKETSLNLVDMHNFNESATQNNHGYGALAGIFAVWLMVQFSDNESMIETSNIALPIAAIYHLITNNSSQNSNSKHTD